VQVEHALDEAIVVQVAAAAVVVAGAEVEQEIAVGPAYHRSIGHEAEHERPKPRRGLAVADVDDAPVVELLAAGPVGVAGAVEAAGDGKREVPPGVQQPAVVLAEPLALLAQLGMVAIGPEAPEECRPVDAAGRVEAGEVGVRGDRARSAR
jgi:hypothetical protein